MKNCDIAVFGAGIIDVPVVHADPTVFTRHSTPVDYIGMTTGGDALNEATVLAHLGRSVRLISHWGCDAAGDYLIRHCSGCGIDTQYVHRDPSLDTGVNIVLVDEDGQRRFYSNRNGSLRKLVAADFHPDCLDGVRLFSLASIFVFPLISIQECASMVHTARSKGICTCADFVLPKQGETIDDLRPLMCELDYIFANEVEAQTITGQTDPRAMADAFLRAGASHAIIKLGADGCLVASSDGSYLPVPACPNTNCVDTTGAGDNFAAGFQHALLSGASLEDCAYFANACAAVSVETVGASDGVQSEQQVRERYKRYGRCEIPGNKD
ncbi:MAG: carbohydrate kinase family protein [Butyricicoccus sp.]